MVSLDDVHNELQVIKERNARVEADKAWETSWSRKALILILTYVVIVIFFFVIGQERPFVSALVPLIAFMISTVTVPVCKKIWLQRVYRK